MHAVFRRPALPLIVLILALILGACASEDGTASSEPSTTDAVTSEASPVDDAALNDADVTFLQNMIPHHEQANEMADFVADRSERPELEELASEILATQTAEIDEMRSFLEAAGEDAGGMEGMDMSSMPGMMDEASMTELRELQGQDFDLRFVEMMTEHHEGAIEMAETVLADGQSPEVADLADRIIAAQEAEIEMMRQWQEEWA